MSEALICLTQAQHKAIIKSVMVGGWASGLTSTELAELQGMLIMANNDGFKDVASAIRYDLVEAVTGSPNETPSSVTYTDCNSGFQDMATAFRVDLAAALENNVTGIADVDGLQAELNNKADIEQPSFSQYMRVMATREGTTYNNAAIVFDGPRYGTPDGGYASGRGMLTLVGNSINTGSILFLNANSTSLKPTDDRDTLRGWQMGVEIASDYGIAIWDDGVELFRVHRGGGVSTTILTTTERDALTPINGMVIYNETTDKLQVYAGNQWVDLH